MGDYDKVMDMLERVQSAGDLDVENLYGPLVDELRGLPRFQALLQKAVATR